MNSRYRSFDTRFRPTLESAERTCVVTIVRRDNDEPRMQYESKVDKLYWGEAVFSIINISVEEAVAALDEWLAKAFTDLLPDLVNCRFRGVRCGDAPASFQLQRHSPPSDRNIWDQTYWRCPLHKKFGCRVRIRKSLVVLDTGCAAGVIHQHGTHHTHTMSAYTGGGPHPLARV